MNPKISIIIPVFNGEKTIQKTLESALSQKYDNFDVIVINDASRDNTLDILKSFKDDRLKIIDCKTNIGRSKARNLGVKSSDSDFISFLDADDLIPENKLSLQIKYMLENSLDICGTCGTAIDINGHRTEYKQPVDNSVIQSRIFKSHTFIHSSVMMKKEIFINANGYDTNLNFSEDYDLFLRIVPHFKVGNLPDDLVTYLLPHGFKYALKEQIGITKIRIRALLKYNYSWKNLPFVFTPIISLFIPRNFKLFIKKIIN